MSKKEQDKIYPDMNEAMILHLREAYATVGKAIDHDTAKKLYEKLKTSKELTLKAHILKVLHLVHSLKNKKMNVGSSSKKNGIQIKMPTREVPGL